MKTNNMTSRLFLITFCFGLLSVGAMSASLVSNNKIRVPVRKTVVGRQLFAAGKSDYVIVVSPAASTSEVTAANELQSCLKEMSGITLPIKKDYINKGKHIFVGYNNWVAALTKAKKPDSKDERYTYCNVGGDIFIYGGSIRGTLYGVYSFLEHEMGCRWYTPTATVIPKRSSWSFTRLNRSEAPGIAKRNILYFEAKDPVWAAHNLCNEGWSSVSNEYGDLESYFGAHTSGLYVPASEFFQGHPEYFSLINGKRDSDAQLCLSNPEVLRICIDRIKKAIIENPNCWVYDMSQNDNQKPCQCEHCQALAKKYGGESGVWVWFVNQVAEAIEKEFPDKYIGTFAYQYSRRPPVGIAPRQNVVIRLCSIECCFVHSLDACSQNRSFIDDIIQWSKIAPHLYIWDYVVAYSQYLAPFPNFNVLQPNIQTFQKHHAIGIMEEAQYQSRGGELAELRAYLLAKLLWNPFCDANAVVDDFINGYYGSAAKAMRQYFDLLQSIVKPDTHLTIYPKADDPIFTDDFIKKGSALFEKAKKDCVDEETLSRIERASLAMLYLKCMRNKEASKRDGTYQELLRIAKCYNVQINEGTDLTKFQNEMNNENNN